MNKNVKDQVIELIKNYPDIKRKIALLRYELEHLQKVSPDEVLESMAFARSESDGHSSGSISDKTLHIAANYREAADRLNAEAVNSILSRLVPLERDIDRLEHYVSLLDEHMATVIRLYHFERMSWERVSDEMLISVKTLRKWRNEAVDKLVEMYEFMQQ